MKRPLAYITAAWSGDEFEDTDKAAWYCRKVYEAGLSPICPLLFMPLFLNNDVPEEHKNGADIGRDLLRRSRVLVVCGRGISEDVKALLSRIGIDGVVYEEIIIRHVRPLDKVKEQTQRKRSRDREER